MQYYTIDFSRDICQLTGNVYNKFIKQLYLGGITMPYIIVKMYPGRTQAQKEAMRDAITEVIQTTLGAPEQFISIAVEEIAPELWPEQVYKPDILDKEDTLIKKPGYNPFKK